MKTSIVREYKIEEINELIGNWKNSIAVAYKEESRGAVIFGGPKPTGFCDTIVINEEISLYHFKVLVEKLINNCKSIIFLDTNFISGQIEIIKELIKQKKEPFSILDFIFNTKSIDSELLKILQCVTEQHIQNGVLLLTLGLWSTETIDQFISKNLREIINQFSDNLGIMMPEDNGMRQKFYDIGYQKAVIYKNDYIQTIMNRLQESQTYFSNFPTSRVGSLESIILSQHFKNVDSVDIILTNYSKYCNLPHNTQSSHFKM